jgi:hypothetical protein
MLAIWFETIDCLDAGDAVFQSLQALVRMPGRPNLLKQTDTLFQRLQRNVGVFFELHHLDNQLVPLGEVFHLIAKQIGKTFCILRYALDCSVEAFARGGNLRLVVRVVIIIRHRVVLSLATWSFARWG